MRATNLQKLRFPRELIGLERSSCTGYNDKAIPNSHRKKCAKVTQDVNPSNTSFYHTVQVGEQKKLVWNEWK